MRRALIAAFSNFIQKNGRIIRIMMAGGGHDTLPKLNYEEI